MAGKTSFVDKMISGKGHLVHRIKATDNSNGERAYYFVLIEPPKEAAFMKAIDDGGNLNLEDYGKVIASCYGEEPSQEVKDLLNDKYGFDV